MKTALVYLALLACGAFAIWRAAKRAGRAEVELKNAEKQGKASSAATDILSEYINLNSDELLSRVRKKREAATQRVHSESGLDGRSIGQSERQEQSSGTGS